MGLSCPRKSEGSAPESGARGRFLVRVRVRARARVRVRVKVRVRVRVKVRVRVRISRVHLVGAGE